MYHYSFPINLSVSSVLCVLGIITEFIILNVFCQNLQYHSNFGKNILLSNHYSISVIYTEKLFLGDLLVFSGEMLFLAEKFYDQLETCINILC